MMRRTRAIQLIELQHGQRLEALIREGIEGGQTWGQIAAALGCSRPALLNWARKMGAKVTRTVRFSSEDAVTERVS